MLQGTFFFYNFIGLILLLKIITMPIFKVPLLGSIVKSAIELRSKISIDTYYKPQGYNAQKRTLKKLIHKSAITAFGEHYNFSEILKEKDFVKSISGKSTCLRLQLHFQELVVSLN